MFNSNDKSLSTSVPVFLVGFPRSGTTLLDSVLRSHPDIEVLEEKHPLICVENLAINSYKKRISDFNLLTDSELIELRSAYMDKIMSYSLLPSKVVVDKLPLNIIAIPLIHILFPDAKVIFALRHPCDSILSCFQQIFRPNSAMANFTSLEKSIDFYDRVMTGWTVYNDNIRVNYTTFKYEHLLDNFDESMLGILDHLGLEWNDNIRDFMNTAISRGLINTPSSSQVVKPLYKSSVGRWKNYQKYFS